MKRVNGKRCDLCGKWIRNLMAVIYCADCKALIAKHNKLWKQTKQYNPDHEVTGGYLRQNDLNEEWRKAYDLATDEDKELLLALPNFDADVFLEITGIDVRDDAKDLTVA